MVVANDITHRAMTNKKYITENIDKTRLHDHQEIVDISAVQSHHPFPAGSPHRLRCEFSGFLFALAWYTE